MQIPQKDKTSLVHLKINDLRGRQCSSISGSVFICSMAPSKSLDRLHSQNLQSTKNGYVNTKISSGSKCPYLDHIFKKYRF